MWFLDMASLDDSRLTCSPAAAPLAVKGCKDHGGRLEWKTGSCKSGVTIIKSAVDVCCLADGKIHGINSVKGPSNL